MYFTNTRAHTNIYTYIMYMYNDFRARTRASDRARASTRAKVRLGLSLAFHAYRMSTYNPYTCRYK